MKKDHRIEIIENGLVCDNVSCDHKEPNIKFEDMHNWINKICPKCGENLLTLNDYNNTKQLFEFISLVDSLSDKEIEEIAGLKIKDSDKKFIMQFGTHKKLSVKSIKPVDDETDQYITNKTKQP